MTNKKITEEELKAALDRVSSGKTPGIDSIEREFLLRFWKLPRTNKGYSKGGYQWKRTEKLAAYNSALADLQANQWSNCWKDEEPTRKTHQWMPEGLPEHCKHRRDNIGHHRNYCHLQPSQEASCNSPNRL